MPALVTFLAATAGACTFVVLWATGLNADVAGLVALGILGIGVLVQMAGVLSGDESG
jgi:hypothetical protein